MKRKETELLLLLEICCSERGGALNSKYLKDPETDIEIINRWKNIGLLEFKEIPKELQSSSTYATHFCALTKTGWDLAHKERLRRSFSTRANYRQLIDWFFRDSNDHTQVDAQ